MMETMNTTARNHLRSTSGSAEQLTLLPTTTTPARFRLSNDTRQRGLRHVAEIRQMLADRAEQPSTANTTLRHVEAA